MFSQSDTQVSGPQAVSPEVKMRRCDPLLFVPFILPSQISGRTQSGGVVYVSC